MSSSAACLPLLPRLSYTSLTAPQAAPISSTTQQQHIPVDFFLPWLTVLVGCAAGIEAAWHLDKIKVHTSATNQTVIFMCRAWLDATSGDGRLERMFYPLVDYTYKVELHTSDLLGAGTSANAVISLIGKLAEAGPFRMANDGNSFQRGGMDEMTLDGLPDIGPIQQVGMQLSGNSHVEQGTCLISCPTGRLIDHCPILAAMYRRIWEAIPVHIPIK